MYYTYLPYTTYSICIVVGRAVCYLQEHDVFKNCKLKKRLKFNTSTIIHSNICHCTKVINIYASGSYFPEFGMFVYQFKNINLKP